MLFSPLRVLTYRLHTRGHLHTEVLKQTFQNNIGKMNDRAHDRREENLFSLN